jgi:signal transduction histidine kinase/AmiR/NasT family two-component response regulator
LQLSKVTSFLTGFAARFKTPRQDGAIDTAKASADTLSRNPENARQYRDLLDAQAFLIVRRDAQGRVIFANRAYLSAFGFAERDLAGRSLAPRVLSQEKPGLGSRTVELVETVSGQRWIEWEESENLGTDGTVETQRTGRDITEERRTSDELRQSRDEAIAANMAKSRFLAIMSHEIRTPMNGIVGITDLLLEGPLTPEQKTHARVIAQSARALMTLIDEILDFSRIEAGKLELTEAPFSISETIQGCIALLEPNAFAKQLDLDWGIKGPPPPLLMGDEKRVRQILLNLISNAVKFTDKGRISVSLRADGDSCDHGPVRVRLSVTDTGIGLTSRECETVFAEFERADAAAQRHDGGTGLGLAIARQIARAMHGDISVESVPGRGSTFHAELMFDRACPNAVALREALRSTSAEEPDTSEIPPPEAGAHRVLLVEDNAVNALLATRLLEREGCSVVRARTGDEAVASVARSLAGVDPPFDLILMDIYMPRLDGIEAARAMRRAVASRNDKTCRLPPIIAVTANAFEADRQRYLAAGMDDYLAKPFDASALRAILRRWLSGGQKLPAA